MNPANLPADPVARLLAVMAALRNPDGGCPWDIEQTFQTLAKYTLEEAYEVVEAVEKQDMPALRDELGDLLLQIVFYAQMAREKGHFDFSAIAAALNDKLIRRHPHVFGNDHIASAEAMTERWERDKARERAAKTAAQPTRPPSAMDGITATLPALTRSQKIIARATRAGFDWEKPADVFPKMEEEIAELKAELPASNHERMTEELGDVLFTTVCLAHKLKIDPETALRQANMKFERRFRAMEGHLAAEISENTPVSLALWESAWSKIKDEENKTTY